MPKPHVECKIRDYLKSTQEELAEAVQCDPRTLNRIIRGHRNPRLPLAQRLARHLGTTIDNLWPSSTPKRRK